jgi:hypothetical protein
MQITPSLWWRIDPPFIDQAISRLAHLIRCRDSFGLQTFVVASRPTHV